MPLEHLKRLFLGNPLPTAQSRQERLGKATALATFASDALSSVAYATEEILLVLILAGTVALSHSLPIGVAIALLIAIVVSSYRQTIRAYPQGGGSYIVTKDNLGTYPGLVRRGRGAALARGHDVAAADDQHRARRGRRPPPRRRQGHPVRPDAVAEPEGGVRRDGPRPHAQARGEVGQVGDGRATDRADLTLPVAAGAAARVRRPTTRRRCSSRGRCSSART